MYRILSPFQNNLKDGGDIDIEPGELVALLFIAFLVGYCVLMRKLRAFRRRAAKGADRLEEFLPELREHGVTNCNWTWSSEARERDLEEPVLLARKVLEAHRGKTSPRILEVTGKSMGHPLIEKLTLERVV